MKLNTYKWKKEKLNNAIYKVHLKVPQEWGKTWYPIEKSLNKSLNKELECKYKTMDNKFEANCRITIKYYTVVSDGVHTKFHLINVLETQWDVLYQDRHCMYNVTLRRVHATTVAVEKQ